MTQDDDLIFFPGRICRYLFCNLNVSPAPKEGVCGYLGILKIIRNKSSL